MDVKDSQALYDGQIEDSQAPFQQIEDSPAPMDTREQPSQVLEVLDDSLPLDPLQTEDPNAKMDEQAEAGVGTTVPARVDGDVKMNEDSKEEPRTPDKTAMETEETERHDALEQSKSFKDPVIGKPVIRTKPFMGFTAWGN